MGTPNTNGVIASRTGKASASSIPSQGRIRRLPGSVVARAVDQARQVSQQSLRVPGSCAPATECESCSSSRQQANQGEPRSLATPTVCMRMDRCVTR